MILDDKLEKKLIFGRTNDVLEEIKIWTEGKKIPIFIWGTGSVAVGVYKNLSEKGIRVEGFFYDTESAVIDPRIEEQKELVLAFPDVLNRYLKIAVIIGHSRYELAKKMNEVDSVVKIWALTGIIRVGIKLDEMFIKENMKQYEYTYSKLADEDSKKNMVFYLNAHLTNDGTNIIENFKRPANFFDNDIFTYDDDETYCDCGAYDGKSIKQFLNIVNYKYHSIYAIEVMDDMCKILKNDKIFLNKKINIINVGLSDHVGTDYFSFDSQSTCLVEDGVPVRVNTIDNIVREERVSLIKIAIGNSIDKILLGGKETIKRDLPKIVIMAGVDKNSLLNYVKLIETIAGENRYKYYLRYTNATTDCLCLFVKAS